MHAVIETPTYLTDAKAAGVTDDERAAIVLAIASDPTAGDVIPGTGGIRKVRVAGKGKGKSGGYRIISYYAAADGTGVPAGPCLEGPARGYQSG